VNGVDVTTGGDLIVAIDGHPVRGADDVGRLVSGTLLPEQTVPFTIVRDGKRTVVRVTLGQRPQRGS
jgi:S1-C subfamily serine protease